VADGPLCVLLASAFEGSRHKFAVVASNDTDDLTIAIRLDTGAFFDVLVFPTGQRGDDPGVEQVGIEWTNPHIRLECFKTQHLGFSFKCFESGVRRTGTVDDRVDLMGVFFGAIDRREVVDLGSDAVIDQQAGAGCLWPEAGHGSLVVT
jgi:hypothetical protein